MKAYRITTPFWAESGKNGEEGTWRMMYSQKRRGGFAFAVQLHREVRPESGLVGIVEHIEVNKR